MILRLGHKVFPKIGGLPTADTHLDYVHSINLEEATA